MISFVNYILIIICSLIIIQNPVYADGSFVLDISVPRVSKFQLLQFHKQIKKGDNIIGQFVLENNTIDGFALSLESDSLGTLSPQSNSDGIVSIPYTIWLEKRTGDVASGVFINDTPTLTQAFLLLSWIVMGFKMVKQMYPITFI